MSSIPKMAVVALVARCAVIALIAMLYSSLAVVGNNLAVTTVPTALVYTWQQSAKGDWQSPSSWTPARIMPAPSDILIFNLGGVTTATNIPTETIGQLLVSGNTTVNLQSASAVILNIAGDNGEDLTVAPNSALNFVGENAIVCNLASGATAAINGFIRFSSSSSAEHRLTAVDTNAIIFDSGGVFMAMDGFAGNPFGTTNLNSVIFDSGSVYICMSGGDPFGAVEPASVIVFKTGSLFSLQGNVMPSFTGRTYANFEVNYPGPSFLIDASGPMSVDDLTLTAGGIAFYQTGELGLSIKGNITVNLQTRLSFMSGTFRLNGSTTQVISGFGSTGHSINRLVIDNPSGIILQRPYGAWNVELVNGKITTVGMVYLGVSGVVTRTNGYVNGYMKRIFSAPETFVCDIGTESDYSPITIDVTAGTFPTAVTVKTVQATQPNISDPSKALLRYWEVYRNGDMTADLTFHYFDSDVPATANEQNFIIQKYNGSAFSQQFGVIDTAANTFRVNGLTEFYRDWTLVESGVIVSPTPTASPTPTSTATQTATPTATSTPLAVVSGTITYGNAVGAATPGFVSNVTVTGTGPSTIFTTTIFPNGDYSLTAFQPGAYTVTPTKTGGINGSISSFDAGMVAQHVAGTNILTGNQLIVADVSGNGTLSSFDAGQIARYAAGLSGSGSTGNWVFSPVNRTYASVTTNITGEDYSALLMGEVSGNWTNNGARAADNDGDGKADISVFRPSTGTWYRQNSGNGSFFGVQFGASEDKPTVGDWDGDGKADVAVFRPSTGAWYRINSGDGSIYGELFGVGSDVLTPADYDGDRKTDLAVYRPSTGIWYLKYSANSAYDYKVFGLANDIPAAGDFDGDGRADICVFRPSDGTWYRQNSSNGQFIAVQFGTNGDKPTMTAFRY